MYDKFESRDTVAYAISQEDTDLNSHAKFLSPFGADGPPFAILADLNREKTKRYDRTTTYLIDRKGIVREIFPATVRLRPDWRAVLNRIDAMSADEKNPTPKDKPANDKK